MFKRTQNEKTGLEKAIEELHIEMNSVTADTEQYSQMADQLVKLYKLREFDSPKKVSPDTLVLVGGNLLGIALIVGHERAHVVTSKALSFVLKLK
jgi:hypothetical protein